MALKQAPYYWFECDKCGVSSGEDSDYSAWSDHGHALDEIVNSEWWISADELKHYCRDCAPKCEGCRATLEHDGSCEDCDRPAEPGLIPGQTAIDPGPDETLAAALADPEGQALVQAIIDRKLNH